MLSIKWNYAIGRMAINELCIATLLVDGVASTVKPAWQIDRTDVASGVVDGSNYRVKAIAGGQFSVTATLPDGRSYTALGFVLGSPPPVRKRAAALDWKLLRDDIQVWATNFYYNTNSTMYKEIARRFDCLIGHSDIVPEILKLNPNVIYAPYTLEYTSIVNGQSLESAYLGDLQSWATVKELSNDQIEAMFLHKADGTRLQVSIWGSARNVGDPRNKNWRGYQVDRFMRLAKGAHVRAIFIDEFGSNQVNHNYGLAVSGSDLADVIAQETSLIGLIEEAIYPCQLIVNTASYTFQNDADIAHAAFGVHMEQINNPMSLDWWNTSWPFIDRLLAAGVLVDIVPPYNFYEYESVHDSKGNKMDTPRGKLLELAAYYMMVTDPHLLAFHVENGDWGKFTLISNWIGQIDGKLGRALEARQKQPGLHVFQRRFTNGLVLVNPVADRLPADYAAETQVVLPNDRKYGVLNADLTVSEQVKSVMMRCPEAMFFKVIP